MTPRPLANTLTIMQMSGSECNSTIRIVAVQHINHNTRGTHSGVMVIMVGNGPRELRLNPEAVCISHCANNIYKGMHPNIFLLANGK